jgi:hypothetical protein
MAESRWSFEVEHAGCSSCAERISGALSAIVDVEEIVIDEEKDMARLAIRGSGELSQAEIRDALVRASVGSGHEYHIKRGSWQVLEENGLIEPKITH